MDSVFFITSSSMFCKLKLKFIYSRHKDYFELQVNNCFVLLTEQPQTVWYTVSILDKCPAIMTPHHIKPFNCVKNNSYVNYVWFLTCLMLTLKESSFFGCVKSNSLSCDVKLAVRVRFAGLGGVL